MMASLSKSSQRKAWEERAEKMTHEEAVAWSKEMLAKTARIKAMLEAPVPAVLDAEAVEFTLDTGEGGVRSAVEELYDLPGGGLLLRKVRISDVPPDLKD